MKRIGRLKLKEFQEMNAQEMSNVVGGYEIGHEQPCTGQDMLSCLEQTKCSTNVNGVLMEGTCGWHYLNLYTAVCACILEY